MIDAILSYPSEITDPKAAQEMPLEMFNSLLDLVENEIQGKLALHANWHNPPAYLEEALQHTAGRALHVKGCFYNELSMYWIKQVLKSGGSIALSPKSLATCSLKEVGALFSKYPLNPPASVELFIPLPHPDFKHIDLTPMLEAGLPIQTVILAVGWQDFYAGPEPINDNDHDHWASQIETAINALTEAGLATRSACGLPLCIFSTDQLGRLAKRNVRFPIGHCSPDVVVAPDGNLRACQRLDLPEPQTYSSIQSIGKTTTAISRWLKPFRTLCPLSDEMICRSAICGACGCGCLATSMAAWKNPANG